MQKNPTPEQISRRKRFGQSLIFKREKRGLTRAQMAVFLGIPYTTLRNIELGDFTSSLDRYLDIGTKLGYKKFPLL